MHQYPARSIGLRPLSSLTIPHSQDMVIQLNVEVLGRKPADDVSVIGDGLEEAAVGLFQFGKGKHGQDGGLEAVEIGVVLKGQVCAL